MIVKRRTINQYIFSENRRRRKSCNRTKQKLYTHHCRITVVLASTSGKAKPFVIRPTKENDARGAAVVTGSIILSMEYLGARFSPLTLSRHPRQFSTSTLLPPVKFRSYLNDYCGINTLNTNASLAIIAVIS